MIKFVPFSREGQTTCCALKKTSFKIGFQTSQGFTRRRTRQPHGLPTRNKTPRLRNRDKTRRAPISRSDPVDLAEGIFLPTIGEPLSSIHKIDFHCRILINEVSIMLPKNAQNALNGWITAAGPVVQKLYGQSEASWQEVRALYMQRLEALFPAIEG